MFWALAAKEIDTRGFEFEHVLSDIATLNDWARKGRLEVTAISLHVYGADLSADGVSIRREYHLPIRG